MKFISFLILIVSASTAHASVNRLCMRTCYNRVLQSAPAPCKPSIDFNDHESREAFECACSAPFTEAATQCGIQSKCSDKGDASAASVEVLATVQEECEHLGEHWSGDVLVTGVDGITSTSSSPQPTTPSNSPSVTSSPADSPATTASVSVDQTSITGGSVATSPAATSSGTVAPISTTTATKPNGDGKRFTVDIASVWIGLLGGMMIL
ncbi:hypothetical protein HDU97_008195 [Phlyctochytrium planicorne]|nr:hypothetical protein HDU97_008195 [Phlyctochytrium planicorne]